MKTEIRHSVEQLLSQTAALCDTGYVFALHNRFTRPSFMYRSYPQSWITRYDEKSMIIEDPVVRWGLRETGVMRWSELEDPDGILADAAAHGLTNGLACAAGPSSSRSISGFTRSDRAFSDDEAEMLLDITQKLHQLTQQLL
jgi:hypothetical protein